MLELISNQVVTLNETSFSVELEWNQKSMKYETRCDLVERIKSHFGCTTKTEEEELNVNTAVICIDKEGNWERTVYSENPRDDFGGIKYCDLKRYEVDLSEISKRIQQFSIVINIKGEVEKGQHLGRLENCVLHLSDCNSKRELFRYEIKNSDEFIGNTGIFIADVYRLDAQTWGLETVGKTVKVKDIHQMVAIRKQMV